MLVDDGQKLLVRLAPGLKEALGEVVERRVTNQQKAINGLINWFVKQDDMLQSLVIGQIPELYIRQAAELALRKLLTSSPQEGGIGGHLSPEETGGSLAKIGPKPAPRPSQQTTSADRLRTAAKDMGPRRMKPQ